MSQGCRPPSSWSDGRRGVGGFCLSNTPGRVPRPPTLVAPFGELPGPPCGGDRQPRLAGNMLLFVDLKDFRDPPPENSLSLHLWFSKHRTLAFLIFSWPTAHKWSLSVFSTELGRHNPTQAHRLTVLGTSFSPTPHTLCLSARASIQGFDG